MTLHLPHLLALVWFLSEVYIYVRRRSTKGDKSSDGHSLLILWGSGFVFVSMAFGIAATVRFGRFSMPEWGLVLIVLLFVSGMAIRWYAILRLGSFFTVDVAISSDHQLVTTGLYGVIRHPSYTGCLLILAALSLSFRNWISALLAFTPFLLAMLWRIRIEEKILRNAFGQEYDSYRARTKRLLPYLY